MRTRLVYYSMPIFATAGLMFFAAAAVRAIFRGRLEAAIGLSIFSVCVGWLAWTLFTTLRQFRRKYAISSDCISCVTEKVPTPIPLTAVKRVKIDDRKGYLYLLGPSDEELLRVQIDNPIVPELKAHFTTHGIN